MTTQLKITVGPLVFKAKMEMEKAPKTCEAFRKLLPWKKKIIHCRWSGESTWIPLGDFDLGIGFENNTSHPSRGDILIYPGGLSETEVLFPYGGCSFAAKVGPLSGNHFLTIVEGQDQFPELGRLTLWEGAQDILFEEIAS